jgi:hypothetical protein
VEFNFHSSFIFANMLSDIILPLKILPEMLIFSLLLSQWTISLCLGRPACDVAISGLGWISIEPVSKSIKISDPNLEETDKELHLTVHVPKPVEIFVRPPIPVAKTGAEWYQYRELTEKEEEARPKCYF